jgi:hypothetical protein
MAGDPTRAQQHQARGSLTEAPLQSAPPRTSPTVAELVELHGGAEALSRYVGDGGVPIQGVKVITQAELDEQRAQAVARNTPGVPYREPVNHEVPHEESAPRIMSKFIRESLADGFTWA